LLWEGVLLQEIKTASLFYHKAFIPVFSHGDHGDHGGTEEERKDNRAAVSAYLLPACRQTGQAGREKSSKKYFSYRLPDSALVEAAQGRTRP
jgi:hypothetical protein